MELLKVESENFKNCKSGFSIDFIAISKKTAEDKEYELHEIDTDLYVYNTVALIGKNASGKTTAIELIECAYDLLGTFRLENKHYSYDNINLTIYFYENKYIYKYIAKLKNSADLVNKAVFVSQELYSKKYYKSKLKDIYSDEDFKRVKINGSLPEDTSILFFVLNETKLRGLYFDSFGKRWETYRILFKTIEKYKIDKKVLFNIFKIFDDNITRLEMLDNQNYLLGYGNQERVVSEKELFYFLSSGTTKGILLYALVVASLKEGFTLMIDEIENHFHKTLVENILALYRDKTVNRSQAVLVFTTHYCELLDLFNRQDNIWICKNNNGVVVENMYRNYSVRNELLKSRQFYDNTFSTAVNYEELMRLKRSLQQ